MKLFTRYDIIAFVIILIPFIYLASVWGALPDQVPIHWNAEGEIDNYGDKIMLVIIPMAMPLLTYLIFIFAPIVDPKKRLDSKNKKFQSFKVLFTGLMSALAVFIIYSSYNSANFASSVITIILGVLFIILGNYIKTLKPNYFIGIRTPWTLENENVWRKTHKTASVLWFVGGLFIVLLSFILPAKLNFTVFITITIAISIIPILHSYFIYRGEK